MSTLYSGLTENDFPSKTIPILDIHIKVNQPGSLLLKFIDIFATIIL